MKQADNVGSTRFDAKFYKIEMLAADKAEENYRKDAEKVIRIYAGEENAPFNILWSNVETLKPAVYSSTALPDIRRRHNDNDYLARDCGIVLERSIRTSCEVYDFDGNIRMARDENLLTGRGVARVVYDTDTEGEGDDLAVAYQKLETRYVNYEDFRMSPAKCWEDVRWVAFKHTPTREEGVEQFGEIFNDVPLMYSVADTVPKEIRGDDPENLRRAVVWEIWDKQRKMRVWHCPDFNKLLKEEEDPLGLDGFYPMPKPLYSFFVPGGMIPRSEFKIYQHHAKILDETTKKIDELIKELKFAGFISGIGDEIKKLRQAKNGEFIPLVNVGMDVKVRDMIAFWPIEEIARTLLSLYESREKALQVIYQITGLSDIVRGATKAAESATAQQMKGNYATLRMEPRQRPMQEFIRDIFRIKAEILAEHFTQENLQAMSGMEVTEEMMALLRSERTRYYRIDVETDTTVRPDADADKQRRTEFIQAVTQFLVGIGPLVQAGAIPQEVAKAMLSFGAKGFNVGKEMEEAIDGIGSQPMPPPQQPQDHTLEIESAKIQAQAQSDQMNLQAKAQSDQMAAQAKIQSEQMAAQAKLESERIKADSDARIAEVNNAAAREVALIEAETEIQIAQMKIAADMQLEKHKGAVSVHIAKATRQPSLPGMEGEEEIDLPDPFEPKKPKRRVVTVRRQPDGSLVGESIEIQDEVM